MELSVVLANAVDRNQLGSFEKYRGIPLGLGFRPSAIWSMKVVAEVKSNPNSCHMAYP